ncbi:hypothetical protein BHE74_00037527 [Ensete ventricosum]|nr:hypothetical protein BHE74_00037527 [Ensete ventricosum]
MALYRATPSSIPRARIGGANDYGYDVQGNRCNVRSVAPNKWRSRRGPTLCRTQGEVSGTRSLHPIPPPLYLSRYRVAEQADPCGAPTTAQSQAKYVCRVGYPGEVSLQISHSRSWLSLPRLVDPEMKQRQACELCGGEAAIFCQPDAAFLCWACDASVHGANFLVARHVRWVACGGCYSLDSARRVSGPAPWLVRSLCGSCDPDHSPSPPSHPASSSYSSSCLSTSESTAAPSAEKPVATRRATVKRRRGVVDERVEGFLVSWSRRMGLRSRRPCVEAAAHVVAACEVTAALPLRVSLAAALWLAIKLCEDEASSARGQAAALRRLEVCSSVPARLILAAESRIAGRVRVAKEGWAECP